MLKIQRWVEHNLGFSTTMQENLISSVVVLACLWGISRFLLRIVFKWQPDSRKLYQWKKSTNYVITGLGIILLTNIWFGGIFSIATYLGLLSVGLVVALREPILNMFGWIYLLWKRPFRIGDRIKISDHTGDVIDITLFQFTLNELGTGVDSEQPTGHVVHIPNSHVFTRTQVNYNYGFPFLWHELQVHVTLESNWRKAKEILTAIGQKHAEQLNEDTKRMVLRESQEHLIFYKDFNTKVYTKVAERGVQFTVRYLCALTRRRESENLIWEDTLTQFLAAPDIKFAYPTTRFYQDSGEPYQEPPAIQLPNESK
ncbi:mechanosensitive ion channel family protein [Rufibacter roseus]